MAVSINVPLSNILHTVERPVVFDVIRKLQDMTQISSETKIRFYGEDARGQQYNSAITKDKESSNLWPHMPNLTIEVEEDHDPDYLLATPVKQENAPPVFEDAALGIRIRPVYSVTTVKIHFIYKAEDKNQATKWRNEIRTRFSMMRDIFMHDITYSWHVPEVYIAILNEIYRLRQNVAPYDDTFPQYLTSHLSSKATFATNMSATQSALVIAEPQAGVQGQFDFEGMPEKASKEDEPNLWATSFTYIFRYDKPINSVMEYPVSVHQQTLSPKYRYNEKEYSYQAISKQYGAALKGLSTFAVDEMDLRYRSNLGLDIPWYDNFSPSSVPNGSVKIANVLTTISEQDKRSLFNLSDLGEFNMRQEVIDFIKASEWQYIAQENASIIQLYYYQGDFINDQSNITVDSNLNVSAVADLDLRKQHRVRISLMANLSMLKRDALVRLKQNPTVGAILVHAINQYTRHSGKQQHYLGVRLPENVIRGIGLTYNSAGIPVPYNNIAGNPYTVFGGFGFNFGLVETLFIRTAPV